MREDLGVVVDVVPRFRSKRLDNHCHISKNLNPSSIINNNQNRIIWDNSGIIGGVLRRSLVQPHAESSVSYKVKSVYTKLYLFGS